MCRNILLEKNELRPLHFKKLFLELAKKRPSVKLKPIMKLSLITNLLLFTLISSAVYVFFIKKKGHVAVPINTSEVTDATLEVTPVIADESNKEQLNILLVDDNDENLMSFVGLVQGHSYRITTARNGQDAIQLFFKKEYDAVFMDMHMPVMDGYETTKKIRESNKVIPIIAFTLLPNGEEIEKCFQFGCNDYLAKPLKKQEVLAMLENIMNKRDIRKFVSPKEYTAVM